MLTGLCDPSKVLVFWGSKILNHVREDKMLTEHYEAAVKDSRVLVIKTPQAWFKHNTVFRPFTADRKIKMALSNSSNLNGGAK